ncbi:MAG: MFS transporter [Legionellales bacterium]|nr:MFS transporter [Legionellales bacterium]|tara:strand:- start:36268 stop:37803 length:1536 start_codon:yes stop_codon:yes gene_type:complete
MSGHAFENNLTNTQRWLITVAVMLVAVIEVLDMTIVNVALPNMMGSLGANADQITWVLTSYLVSSAVCMPLTGFLVNRIGRKRLLLINIVGFLLASMMCGMATSLSEIVLFRTLQGIFGATLVPLSQYVLRDTFPLEEQGKAMAIWGIGIMAGPVLGPTIGGYITESLSWRWIFYLNIPVCIIAFVMAIIVIRETPRKKQHIDYMGLFWMVLGIGTLQIFLDRGNQENWLDSNVIITLVATSIISLGIFIVRGLIVERNIVNLWLFKNRNFCIATTMLTLYCISMFGLMAVQPLMLESLLDYPTSFAGLVMAPRGISCAIGMAMIANLMKRMDVRWLIAFGGLLSAFGSYRMCQYGLDVDASRIMLDGAIQGFGMGFFFVPLSAISLSTLDSHATAEGSGLFSFGRSIGSSIGISILGTVFARGVQINWNRLGGHLSPGSPALSQWLQTYHLTLTDSLTPQLLGAELSRQASMISFVNCFWLSAIGFMLVVPLVLLLKPIDFTQTKLAMGH